MSSESAFSSAVLPRPAVLFSHAASYRSTALSGSVASSSRASAPSSDPAAPHAVASAQWSGTLVACGLLACLFACFWLRGERIVL
jgi:hypothetical protein